MKCGIFVALCVGAISCIRNTLAGKIGSLVEASRPSTQEVTKLPYCPINRNITTLLNQISNGLKGKEGNDCPKTEKVAVKPKRIRRATLTWPYNCGHAALTYHLGQLVLDSPMATCCNACDFPAFTACILSNTADIATRCPQEALQCIEQCTDTHLRRCNDEPSNTLASQEQSNTLDAKPAESASRLPSKRTRCGITTKKKYGGSFCVERACIPIII